MINAKSAAGLLVLAAVSATGTLRADDAPQLKIYSGVRDTLYTPTTTIVALTRPGASAKIAGKDIHVYKTGSFGAEVNLNPGVNTIDIDVSLPEGTMRKTVTIFRADKPAKASAAVPAHDPEATVMYATPVYVTTTDGAYLQYGNGDDRLGGSKLGFIDAGIPLTVIGQKGSLYCVRLSSDRIAYIPQHYTRPAGTVATGAMNTGSWSIVNTGCTDRVTISLPRRLPYQYITQLDPSTIAVDIFGATDNSNWITQRSLELGMISYPDFRQVGEDTYRVILHLKDRLQWGFAVHYDGESSNLVIEVRHAPQSLKLKDLVIGLDAGHGGKYPGAISPSGLKEKDVNLDIILRLNKLLIKEGARTVLTRDGDTGPSMGERKRIWNEANVDLALSVHNNSGGSALSSPGTSAYYKHLFCRPFAECVINRMAQTGLPVFGLVGNFNFSLNGPTLYPECLVEGMFMSSLEEEEKLADPAFRQLVAEKILAGIKDYLALAARR